MKLAAGTAVAVAVGAALYLASLTPPVPPRLWLTVDHHGQPSLFANGLTAGSTVTVYGATALATNTQWWPILSFVYRGGATNFSQSAFTNCTTNTCAQAFYRLGLSQ